MNQPTKIALYASIAAASLMGAQKPANAEYFGPIDINGNVTTNPGQTLPTGGSAFIQNADSLLQQTPIRSSYEFDTQKGQTEYRFIFGNGASIHLFEIGNPDSKDFRYEVVLESNSDQGEIEKDSRMAWIEGDGPHGNNTTRYAEQFVHPEIGNTPYECELINVVSRKGGLEVILGSSTNQIVLEIPGAHLPPQDAEFAKKVMAYAAKHPPK